MTENWFKTHTKWTDLHLNHSDLQVWKTIWHYILQSILVGSCFPHVPSAGCSLSELCAFQQSDWIPSPGSAGFAICRCYQNQFWCDKHPMRSGSGICPQAKLLEKTRADAKPSHGYSELKKKNCKIRLELEVIRRRRLRSAEVHRMQLARWCNITSTSVSKLYMHVFYFQTYKWPYKAAISWSKTHISYLHIKKKTKITINCIIDKMHRTYSRKANKCTHPIVHTYIRLVREPETANLTYYVAYTHVCMYSVPDWEDRHLTTYLRGL